ncbi:hypothetical protein HDZ31DRAFT_65851 [Schizophyllum fasciatum]
MVNTRRQSDDCPKAEAGTYAEPDEDKSTSVQGHNSTTKGDRADFEDSDAPPPPKRARKAPARGKPTKPTPISKHRGPGKISKLLSMPMDILYETFKFLEPLDLLTISQTNKLLRETILSPHALSVWIGSRKHTGCPDPPPDNSEAWWANLVFGKKRCQICNCPSIMSVDWQLLMRVCTTCKKKNLLSPTKFKKEYRINDSSVLDLVLYTNVGGGSHGHATGTRYYWKGDIEYMFKTIASYLKDGLQDPQAKQAYDDFRNRRIAHVAAIETHAPVWATWDNNRYWGNHRDAEKLAETRRQGIKERLILLGYEVMDAERAVRSPRMTVEKKKLTDAGWKRIRPKWEEEAASQRRDRMDVQYRNIVVPRKQIGIELYNAAYRKQSLPREWTTAKWLAIPTPQQVLQLEPFRDLIYADVNANIQTGLFQEALQECAPKIQELKAQNEEKLRRVFNDVERAIAEAGILQMPADSAMPVLDLALATCQSNLFAPAHTYDRCFRATDFVFHHNYQRELQTQFSQSPVYIACMSTAMAALLEVSNLPAATTTFADLDNLNPKVFCSNCEPLTAPMGHAGQVLYMRAVYGWRDAVLHYREKHDSDDNTPLPKWQPLLEENTLRLVRQDEDTALAEAETWSCAHCVLHLDNYQPLRMVKLHAQTKHGIVDPRVGDDVLCMPANPISVNPPVIVTNIRPE